MRIFRRFFRKTRRTIKKIVLIAAVLLAILGAIQSNLPKIKKTITSEKTEKITAAIPDIPEKQRPVVRINAEKDEDIPDPRQEETQAEKEVSIEDIENQIGDLIKEVTSYTTSDTSADSPMSIPAYDGSSSYCLVNNGEPFFSDSEKESLEEFEYYSDLDELGRNGSAMASVCQNLMPTEERKPIGHIKPAGWHTVKYPGIIEDNYLYNRCHLIGFQLTGENDNEKNLITGTRYLNIEKMLDIENEVAAYVKKTGNHVLYRVTPQYTGDNLLCNGLLIEAYSIEDRGEGIKECVYCYNVQPGIVIDYSTGDSSPA